MIDCHVVVVSIVDVVVMMIMIFKKIFIYIIKNIAFATLVEVIINHKKIDFYREEYDYVA